MSLIGLLEFNIKYNVLWMIITKSLKTERCKKDPSIFFTRRAFEFKPIIFHLKIVVINFKFVELHLDSY